MLVGIVFSALIHIIAAISAICQVIVTLAFVYPVYQIAQPVLLHQIVLHVLQVIIYLITRAV